MAVALQFLAGKFAQAASFAHDQVDMLEELFSVELVADVGKTVGVLVKVRLVNLLDITGEDYLGAFSCTGDDGLHFVWGEVLCLIDDEIGLLEAPAPDICERGYLDGASADEFLKLAKLRGYTMETSLKAHSLWLTDHN